MMMSRDWPIASARANPKIRSAPGFQNRMTPPVSAAMRASDRVERTACENIRYVHNHILDGFVVKLYRHRVAGRESLGQRLIKESIEMSSFPAPGCHVSRRRLLARHFDLSASL